MGFNRSALTTIVGYTHSGLQPQGAYNHRWLSTRGELYWLLFLMLRYSENTIGRKPFRVFLLLLLSLLLICCLFVAQESCLNEKFVVFANEIDFQHHLMERHGSRLANRKIQVSLLLPLARTAVSLCRLDALESHCGWLCYSRVSATRHHDSICRNVRTGVCFDFSIEAVFIQW